MPDQDLIVLFVAAAVVGALAIAAMFSVREREEAEATAESPYGISSEGMTRCRKCGKATLATDTTCAYCGTPVPSSAFRGEARIR